MVWSECDGRSVQGFSVFLECVQTMFSFASTIHTIKSQFASKLAVGFQNILRKNPLPVMSLGSPRETCLVIEGGANQPVTSGAY